MSSSSPEDAPSVVDDDLEATVIAGSGQPEPPPVPTRVGRYQVEDVIGSGAMGMVLRARDPELDRIVAIKLLRARKDPSHGDEEARMLREARALAKLSHPHVIDVYDVGTVHGRVFIAMEFVAGATLGRWLADARPSREAIVDAFVQAGLGLAAAHDAGLVHRDFKPANVLRGDDGRVRVVDFGLAAPPRHSEVDPTIGSLDDDAFDLRVTATGFVVGTPAYMAPEAHLGEQVDARSDQFSFSVALFEALWGRRPFPGPKPKDVAAQASRGEIHFPRGVEVPPRLRQIVLRGLAASPEERWPSMQALLERLRPEPRARWPWLVGAAALAAVPLALAWRSDAPAPSCETAVQQVESLWSSDVQQRVQAAFTGSGSTHADKTWPWASAQLATHTQNLADARRDACESRADASVDAARLDRRLSCLRRHQSELVGVVSVLENADTETVRNVVRVVGDLRSLEDCDDEALAAAIAPPPPKYAAAVDQANQDMAQARALLRSGHYEDASAMVRELVTSLESIDYPPVLAEARFLLGISLMDDGEYQAAEAAMNDALMIARQAGHDPLVARACTQLIFLVGNHLRRPDDAEQWVRHARAAVDRLADPAKAAKAAASLDSTLGNFYWMKGEFDVAREHFERSVVAHGKLRGEHDALTIITRSNLGMLYLELGDTAKAESTTRGVLAERIELFGPDHPEVSTTYANLANIMQARGDLDAAVEYTQRAMEGLEATVGRDHPHYPQLLMNLGNNRFLQGRHEEAIEHYRECKALLSESLGPRAFLVGRGLNNMGAALHQIGRNEEARTALVQARDILEEHLSAGHPELAGLVGNLANVDLAAGRHDQALAGFMEAIPMLESAVGPEHPELVSLLAGRSEVYRATERYEEALADLNRALKILSASETDPESKAEVHYDLAEVSWDYGRRVQAIDHMRQAEALVDRAPDEEGNDLPERIATWLAEHPLD